MLRAVQDELNFTYDLVKSKDNTLGGLDQNNKWTGQIGLVQNRIIDMSLMDLTIMFKRAQVCNQPLCQQISGIHKSSHAI